jgi:hypothetical protein
MAERKVVPFDEFYYQLKLTQLFQKHPIFFYLFIQGVLKMAHNIYIT